MLSLSHNKITSKGANMLFKALQNAENISNLHFDQCKLDDGCLKELGELIQNNNIEYLDFGRNNITDDGVKMLSDYLFGNTSLKSIDLSNNSEITNESGDVISEVVQRSCIISVNLHKTRLSMANQDKIRKLIRIPIDERDLSLPSLSKSAAKVS